MALTFRKTYHAPEGWSDITAIPDYASAKNIHCYIVAIGSGGRVIWGGTSAPVSGDAYIPLTPEVATDGTAANVWLFGPCAYTISLTD